MVYIYKKQIGNKVYYYLRISKKVRGKPVVKDVAYLGSSIEEIKKALQNLPKYSAQIRKSYKKINNFIESNRYLEKAEELKLKKDMLLKEKLLDIEACKIHYGSQFQRLDNLTKKEIFKNFVIEFAFNTTSIEGNTIKLNEARNLLEEGILPANKTLREVYDVQNTEAVFNYILNLKTQLSNELIIKIHKMLMANIDVRTGYRTTDVRVIKSNFKATPAPYVKTDMDILLKWYNDNKSKLHPLVLASIFHHKFEKIHPFMDGNGRTGRMLLNFILLSNNYPPMIIRMKNRQDYLLALREADKISLTAISKEYLKLVQFIANEMIENYWSIFL